MVKRPFIVIDVFTEFKRQITEDPGFLQEQEISHMEIKEQLRETEFTCEENIKRISLQAIGSGSAFGKPVLTFIKCYEREQYRPRGMGY